MCKTATVRHLLRGLCVAAVSLCVWVYSLFSFVSVVLFYEHFPPPSDWVYAAEAIVCVTKTTVWKSLIHGRGLLPIKERSEFPASQIVPRRTERRFFASFSIKTSKRERERVFVTM